MIKAQMNVNRPLTGFLAIFDDAVCVFLCRNLSRSSSVFLVPHQSGPAFSFTLLRFKSLLYFLGLIASCSLQLLL